MELGPVPFVLALNKRDLKADWEIDGKDVAKLDELGWTTIETSAMTGEGIEEAFVSLASTILG